MTYPFFAPFSANIVMDTTARADPALSRARLLGAAGTLDGSFSGAGGAGPNAMLSELTFLFMLREIATRLVDLAEPHRAASAADTAPATPNP